MGVALPIVPILILGGLFAATVLGGSSSGGGTRPTTIPPPKRVGRRVQSYVPPTLMSTAPGGAPQRETAPDGLSWSEYSGTIDIGSMRKQGRDVPPGFDTIDLAEVYSGDGPVRIFVDAYVVDFDPATQVSAIARVKNVAIAHAGGFAASGPLDVGVPREQAERLVRDFTTSNDGLVEGEQTTALIEHNERNPPDNVYAFYGSDCHIGNITARDMLFHQDDCRGSPTERNGRPVFAYEDGRAYNLSIEARADGKAYLVARIMRLPMRQHLTWRAYAAARKP